MAQCPTCKQQSLEKRPAGPGQGEWWSCTNPACPAYQQARNLDVDEELER